MDDRLPLLFGTSPRPYAPRRPRFYPELTEKLARVHNAPGWRPDPPTAEVAAALGSDLDAALSANTKVVRPTESGLVYVKRPGRKPKPPIPCVVCGLPFKARHAAHRACSKACGGVLKSRNHQADCDAADALLEERRARKAARAARLQDQDKRTLADCGHREREELRQQRKADIAAGLAETRANVDRLRTG